MLRRVIGRRGKRLLLAIAACATGCAAVVGFPERTADPIATSDGGDGGEPSCGATGTGTCIVVPEQWSLVALAADQRGDCPLGYESPTDRVVAPPRPCSCRCDNAPVTIPARCTTLVGISSDAGCADDAGTFELSVPPTGCQASPFAGVPFASLRRSAVTFAPAVCGGGQAAAAPPTNGRTCLAHVEACPGGGTCAERLGGSQRLCLVHTGDVPACPSGFPTRSLAGSVLTDTRVCAACTCKGRSGTCQDVELDLYEQPACNNNQTPLTTTCRDAPDGGYPSYRLLADVGGGGGSRCEVDVDSTLTSGDLALDGISTLCCR
jgi:hypothetical protein